MGETNKISAPMISAVSIFRYGVKSPALRLQSLARGFQSLAQESKSPAMSLESLAVETKIRKNGAFRQTIWQLET
jgi:hypothetical protein